jgi:lysophospholipase L1-like esterase
MRFLALGDSYTIGESVAASERWLMRLAARLRAEGLDLDEPLIIARTGWTTDELSSAIDQLKPAGVFELVSLLIGVNNQYRGRAAEEYRDEFSTLLKRAIGFADGRPQRVMVLSIPDWGVTPFAADRDRIQIQIEIDAFNAINRAVALHLGAHYIDITPISRRAAADPALVAADGLHPSGKMYQLWVEQILPLAREVLTASAL